MRRLHFSGVIHPERAPLSVSDVRSRIVGAGGAIRLNVALNIWLNQVSAIVETDEADIFTVRNLVRREVEFVADVAGFLLGHAYDVEITKAVGENLSPTQVFGVDIPVLAERAKTRDLGALVNAIFPLCYGSNAVFFRRCLTDLGFAIKRPDDTAFYCFRALESLRHSFGADMPEAEQWKAMAAALGTSKDAMEPLRRHAFPARHGNHLPFTDRERQELFLFTWDTVERYINFRLTSSGEPAAFAEPERRLPSEEDQRDRAR